MGVGGRVMVLKFMLLSVHAVEWWLAVGIVYWGGLVSL